MFWFILNYRTCILGYTVSFFHDHLLKMLITSHVSDVTGEIVLTSFVCLCVCFSPSRYPSQTDRHTDLNFGMEVKWRNI